MSRFPAGFFEAIAGEQRLAEAEGAQQNETDGAAATTTCLLSDMHHNLHRGERCPECGYCFEEIG